MRMTMIYLASTTNVVLSGGIAQLGELLNGIQEVSGSIPLISTKSECAITKNLGFQTKTKVFCYLFFGFHQKANADLCA